MDENQAKQNNLLDTTDCLEAIGVFRGWKNFFFIIAALCLLLLQISFWLVDRGLIKPCDKAKSAKKEEIKEAAEKVAVEPNKPIEESQQKAGFPFGITFEHLSRTIRIVNGLLILTAVLYCLSMLFSLKVSLIGRLGGINHISRAFFLSLILVILLLPWQIAFDGIFPGVIYTPCELVRWCSAEQSSIFATIIHYLRFTGYWLLAALFLIFSHIRSSRWTKAVLYRLEVI